MKKIYLLLTFVTISSCTSLGPVKYQAYEEGFGGYFSKQHSDSSFIVGFRANSSNALQQIADYALLHASETVSTHGCRYFEIKEKKLGGIDKKYRGSIFKTLHNGKKTLFVVNSNTSFSKSSFHEVKMLVKCSDTDVSEQYDAKELKGVLLKNY